MEQVGIKSEIDHLGRIHIPKKIRELYALGEDVELVLAQDGVYIRNPLYTLTRREETP